VRRAAPQSLEDIRHPGPAAEDRLPHAFCHARPADIALPGSTLLLAALAQWAENTGAASAVLNLSGVRLSAFDYVMPDRAIDDRHAAWYSDTHHCEGARLDEAVAILGWRDGDWFAHVHAYWHDDGTPHLGHLLPETLTIAASALVSGHGIYGARFEAAPDPETEFTLFRVKSDPDHLDGRTQNALIATLAPFTDLYDSVAAIGAGLPGTAYTVHGLGSLAGAAFQSGPPMKGLISEILLQVGAGKPEGGDLTLPVRTVDLDKTLHQGLATPDGCPTLVTNELLMVAV